MIMDMSRNKSREVPKDLIPGLPSDLATECLIRVPHQFQPDMKSVCRSWRSLLSDSSFIKERRRCGKAELLLCLVQPLSPPKPASKAVGDTDTQLVMNEKIEKRVSITPRFCLSVYNATTATWNRVAFPQLQIPLFCECVAVQDAGKILLIGGWDPETLQPVKDVYVLDVSSRRWRRGASMKESRSFFSCATVGSTQVYVAGGHDEQKNALPSAEVYDVEKDEWSTLPSMDEGRDECQGFSMGTGLGFCVLSGYATESQGRFKQDGEVYNTITKSWSRIENVWPFPDTSPRGRTVVDTRGSSRLFCFTDRELQSERQWESRDGSRKWKLDVEVMQLPTSGSSIYVGGSGGEPVVMIGGEGVMMKRKTEKNVGKWSHVHDIPFGFSTLPFSHSSIYV
ncbi:unnamed protein product [Eruca vesicaria subsp. sativa]|uniref:F-box domain-containing protein n=1 Tax=Eruca vesicaria subsp. sativa TaxID=29727 RepID=A0ABC8LJB1_ERUVS|nr:unnamed protein product [Eruca vesicaria subsp. sativa]